MVAQRVLVDLARELGPRHEATTCARLERHGDAVRENDFDRVIGGHVHGARRRRGRVCPGGTGRDDECRQGPRAQGFACWTPGYELRRTCCGHEGRSISPSRHPASGCRSGSLAAKLFSQSIPHAPLRHRHRRTRRPRQDDARARADRRRHRPAARGEAARASRSSSGSRRSTSATGFVASVVDVPGHRRLVRAMIAGASGMELVMLVVAADEGVMPQTREHVAVCELLGVDARARRRDEGRRGRRRARADGGRGGARAARRPVARGRRDVLGADGRRARRRARGAARRAPRAAARRRARHVRLGVDRVFTVRGAGTVVTGTLVAGPVAAGDPLFVVGERGARETAARGAARARRGRRRAPRRRRAWR